MATRSKLDPLEELDDALAEMKRLGGDDSWEETSEVTANLHQGVVAKGVPKLGMLIISVAIAVLIVAIGFALVK